MHRAPAAIVADATLGVPLVRFLAEDLEMIPELVCLRSGQTGVRDLLSQELDALNLKPRVIHDADVYVAKEALAQVRPEMLLASSIERHVARSLGIPFAIRIVNPINKFRMTDRAYFGYTGMLNLIEEIQNDWLDRYRSRQRRYEARW
jgi:nitrogenase molybdenum-iron protein alpha/beta subunit